MSHNHHLKDLQDFLSEEFGDLQVHPLAVFLDGVQQDAVVSFWKLDPREQVRGDALGWKGQSRWGTVRAVERGNTHNQSYDEELSSWVSGLPFRKPLILLEQGLTGCLAQLEFCRASLPSSGPSNMAWVLLAKGGGAADSSHQSSDCRSKVTATLNLGMSESSRSSLS